MNKYLVMTILAVISLSGLAGCGGGGGGGGGGVATKAATKVYVFGHMTSIGRLSTVQTTINVPDSVLVNYSSAPGATSGLCILRKGVIVPSGKVLATASDFNLSTYNISSRVLTVFMVNNGRLLLKSSTTGNNGKGEELATVNFNFATPGVIPTAMPLADAFATISQELPGTLPADPPSVSALPGSTINFETTYQ